MALTAGFGPTRRGQPAVAGEFGYYVAPGEKVFRGGLVGINASYQMVRLQTSGCVAFVGMAERDYDNTASSSASPDRVVGMKGTYQLTVPSAAPANINAAVYATDDNTLTLTQSGSLLQVGNLAGFEVSQANQTFVKLL